MSRRRPAVLMLALWLAAGCAVSRANAQRLWPPWMRDLGKEPVFPRLTVSPDSLAVMLGSPDLTILDVRELEPFRKGHIESAVRIAADSLDFQSDLGAAFGDLGLSSRSRLICYGGSSSLVTTARLVWLLHLAGARQVSLLEGGIEKWREQGYPLARGLATPGATPWEGSRDSSRVADAEYVLERFGRRDWEIVDARGCGFVETAAALDTPGSPWREGHIPHAMPVDFRAVVPEGGTFLDPAGIRAHIARTGPRPANPVNLWAEYIVYDDGMSGEGALGYVLLLMAGIESVRYFPGGWKEWCSGVEFPATRIVGAEELRGRLPGPGAASPVKNLILIDVRHDPDYYAGHIPGAVLLPSHRFADSFEDMLAGHWPGADRTEIPVVIYCYGPDCIRSRNCSTYAAQAGFLHLEWFRGGVEEWVESGGVLIESEPSWK